MDYQKAILDKVSTGLRLRTLRCKSKQVISDELLLEQFDWYAEGVKFYAE